jgi:hypothetical protein
MGMTKIVRPSGWDYGTPIAMMVKVSSRGLIGNDRRDFLKIASPVFVDLIDQLKVAKDEVPVHLIALGASEYWGANRNGDGFKEATCKAHHQSFEKYARWYRNHQNKDPQKSYGYVKKSAYHDAMHRIELLCMLNAEKSAADRNGGYVADKELQKLVRGDDPSVSMACRVPYDVCSGCENKARTRDEYCTAKTCKYGGCRDNLTKVAEDGHQLHVDNPNPHWFDISDVFRPADRTAYGAMADYLQKAASVNLWVPGAEMAEGLGVTAPLQLIADQSAECFADDPVLASHVKLAFGLSVLERQLDLISYDTYRAFDPAVQGHLSPEQLGLLGRPGTEKSAGALSALADNKVILTLTDFARWVGKEASAPAAARLLPGVYGAMLERGTLESGLRVNPFATAREKVASVVQRTLAAGLAPSLSFHRDAVVDRSMRSCLRMSESPVPKIGFWNEKQAADAPEAVSLAEQYALYKLAALHRIASFDTTFNLTSRLAVAQNRVM